MPSLLIVLKSPLHCHISRELCSTQTIVDLWTQSDLAQRLLWLHLRVKKKLQTTWSWRRRWSGKSPHVWEPAHDEVPRQLQLTRCLCPMGQSRPTPTIVLWAPILNQGWNHPHQQTWHSLQTPHPHPIHWFLLWECCFEVARETLTTDEHGCWSQHLSNSNSTSIKHLSLLPSPTASSQPTLPYSIHHLSSIIHHQWQLPISSLLNSHHLNFLNIQ